MQEIVSRTGVCSASRREYPPSSGRHAMWCLYVIGRDSWVWDMAITRWLDVHSSHGVGVRSQSVVWPRVGGISRRRLSEIIVIVIVIVIDIVIVIVK